MMIRKIVSIIIIATSITWGCNQGGSGKTESNGNEHVQKEEQVQTPVQQETQPLGLDTYGRKPGNEHYGHDHPPAGPQDQQQQIQTNPQQESASGEPDEYNRVPGDEHYGHDHQ